MYLYYYWINLTKGTCENLCLSEVFKIFAN